MVATNLAAARVEAGARVLLCDLDPQGTAPTWWAHPSRLWGVEQGLVAVPRREEWLARALHGQHDATTDVLVDCPPSLGRLTTNALLVADRIVAAVNLTDRHAVKSVNELHRSTAVLREVGFEVPTPMIVRNVVDDRLLSGPQVRRTPPARLRLRATFPRALAPARAPQPRAGQHRPGAAQSRRSARRQRLRAGRPAGASRRVAVCAHAGARRGTLRRAARPARRRRDLTAWVSALSHFRAPTTPEAVRELAGRWRLVEADDRGP